MAEVAGTGSMETTGNGDSTDTTAEVLRPAFPPIKKEKLADGTEVMDTGTVPIGQIYFSVALVWTLRDGCRTLAWRNDIYNLPNVHLHKTSKMRRYKTSQNCRNPGFCLLLWVRIGTLVFALWFYVWKVFRV